MPFSGCQVTKQTQPAALILGAEDQTLSVDLRDCSVCTCASGECFESRLLCFQSYCFLACKALGSIPNIT